MTLSRLFLAAALVAGAATAQAATPTHIYLMNDGSDVFGGPALTANGGSFGGGIYSFDANQGLSLAGALTESVYTIDFAVSLDLISDYRRLVDFKGLASDTGLYNLDSGLSFYPLTTGPDVFVSGQMARVAITRDSSGMFTGYVNGMPQISFNDDTALATFTGTDRLAWFFQDDLLVPGEASAGQVDYIRIFDVALSAAEVAALATPVPEPGAWVLMLGGLAAVAGAVRRRN